MPKTAQKGASVATVKKQGAVMKHIKKYWQWYAMMFIPIVYYIVPLHPDVRQHHCVPPLPRRQQHLRR